MSFVWSRGPTTAEEVRTHFATCHPMKDSTVRTILRRLETKRYLTHSVEDRRYHYYPVASGPVVAALAVRRIVDRLCGGSFEKLLAALADNAIINGNDLEESTKRIAAWRKPKRRDSHE